MAHARELDILLVVPKSPYRVDLFLQQPIGFLYAAEILARQGHRVSILDLRVSERELGEYLEAHPVPDLAVVTTSTYDLTQCYTWQLATAARAVRELRGHCPRVAIVGAHGTLDPRLTLAEVPADFLLVGEYELAIPQFVAQLEAGIEPGNPVFRPAGKLDLAALPVPDFSRVPQRSYQSYLPVAVQELERQACGLLFANRGCPFTCSYCYTAFFGGTELRLRPVERVLQEMRCLKRAGVDAAFFLDYTFTAPKRWLHELLEAKQEAGIALEWGCQTRAHLVDREMLAEMRKAGCRWIWYGIESPHIASLNQAKPISQQTADRAVAWACEAGIVPMAFMLVGFPGEDIEATAEWAARQPFLFSLERVLPRYGTSLFERTGVRIGGMKSWNELEQAAAALNPDRAEVERSYERLIQLPNYFGNHLPGNTDSLWLEVAEPALELA